MKKIIALLLTLALLAGAIALTACTKKEADETTAAPADTAETTAAGDEETTGAEETAEAPNVTLVTYGRISAIEATGGWEIGADSADWRIVYVKPDEEGNNTSFNVPTLQLTTDDDPVDRLVARVKETKDAGEEVYTEDTVTIAGVEFVNIVPELGFPAMYGTVDGQTLVVTYSKTTDLQDDGVANIIASVHIAPEE